MLRTCSRAVFACFKAVERGADRMTGAVGPVFVAFAIVLMSIGVLYFFAIIGPTLPYFFITYPLTMLCAANMLVHYYFACTVRPGTPADGRGTGEESGWLWAKRRRPKHGVTWSDTLDDWVLVGDKKRLSRCKRCMKPKPERTHHCRVCKDCILKYDHHCPVRINQCVGLRNERHFILFMGWFVISCFWFVVLGYDAIWLALDFSPRRWNSQLPQTGFVLIYVMTLALGFSVSVMLAWHIYLISNGESTVENYDFARYRDMCKHRGTEFVNSYDLGRWRNLKLFFNVVPSGYPYYTLFIPYRCAPYSDGISWARKPGYNRHGGIDEADEMTDVEEEDV